MAVKKPVAKATTKAKPAVKKPAAEMIPLEKARAARAANAASGKKPAAKKGAVKRTPPKKFVFKAPETVKSFFCQAAFATSKDGLLAPGCRLTAIKGKWDNPNAPKYDLSQLDPQTVISFFGRFMNILYAANPARRLPPNKKYMVLLRVGVAGADGSIRVSIKTAWYMNEQKKKKEFTDKTNAEYRKIRRTAKLLAGAFTKVLDMNELKAAQKVLDANNQVADDE
jgi:hypothetical protein